MDRIFFNNNKIKEAICQFSFKTPIEIDLVNKFWDILSKDGKYTKREQSPLVHFNINIFEPNKQLGTKSEENIFSNDNRDKVIKIFPNNLSIHQVGNYTKWEDFATDIKYVLLCFQQIFDVEIARFDIRAINDFEFEKNFNPNENFFIGVKYPDNLINSPNYTFTIEHPYVLGKIYGVVKVNFVSQNDKSNFILDLSYTHFTIDPSINIKDTDNIIEILTNGQIKLYELFFHSITEKTKKLIK